MVYPKFIVLDDATSLDDVYQHSSDITLYALALGRPINAFYIYYLFDIFNSIDSIKYIRLIGLLTIVCCFFPWYSLLRLFLNNVIAFCVAITTFLLPPFVITVLFAQIASYPIAFLCSISAALLVENRLLGSLWPFPWLALLAATSLTTFALYTDQPAAQAIFSLPALVTLGIREQDNLARAVRCSAVVCGIFGISALTYFVSWQIYKNIFFSDVDTGARLLVSSTAQLAAKLPWFLSVAAEASNLFKFDASSILAVGVYGVIAGYFLLLEKSTWERVVRAALWFVFLPATYTANLLVQESWSEYRTQYAIQAYIWISFAAAAWQIFSRFTRNVLHVRVQQSLGHAVAACIVCALVARQAFAVGPALVAPHVQELVALRSAMRDFERERGNAARLVLVRPGWDANTPAFIRYDLIGVPASTAPWAAIPMARLAYWEEFHRGMPVDVIDIALSEQNSYARRSSDYVLNVDTLLRDHSRLQQTPPPFR
jgi:hypothetical protein